MRTIVHLSGIDIPILYPRGKLPKHDGKELSIDDLRIFYTCVWHAKRQNGDPLSEDEIRRIVEVKLESPGTKMPGIVAKLKDPNFVWTQEIAKLVEREDWRDELLLRIALYYEEGAPRAKAIEDAQQAKLAYLNLKKYMRLPRVGSRTLTEMEVQELYAGVCWYEVEGSTLEREQLLTLCVLLLGRKDNPFKNWGIPKFVEAFIQGDNDEFTVEVRRVATLNKKSLLRKVDTVWRSHLQPDVPVPRGYEMAETIWSEPSSSTSGPVVTGNLPQGQQSLGPPIPPGYANFGSAYGPADIRPVTGGLSTISYPSFQFSNPEYDQDSIPGQLSESFQAQFQHAGLYEQQQTPFKRGNPALSSGETPVSSSSGRSASPTRAEKSRQEENEKARRKTTKGDSKNKADESDGKIPTDSRQKKADKSKEAKKRHRPRP